MAHKLKAVLFDIDDTLFDRKIAQTLTLDLIVKKHLSLLGSISPDRLRQAWDKSDDLVTAEFNTGYFVRVARCRHFLELLDLPLEHADELTEQYLADYTSLKVPIAGALDLIYELAKSAKIGVISNSLPDVQYGKLKTLGLFNLLSCIVLSEELGIRKPDPRVFQHAAGLLQVQPSDCLFVGDSFSADVVGAKAAGMLACWLKTYDTIQPQDRVPCPDYTITSLTGLLPLLKKDGLLD